MKKRRISSILLTVFLLFGLMCGPGQDAHAAESARVMVSLGDSYSSGEGIEPFYGQEKPAEEKISDPNWLAHRSKNAWSGMLRLPGNGGTPMSASGENWRFFAASGAETKHIQGTFPKDYNFGGYKDSYPLDPQIRALDGLKDNVDYVTLTLGGNDADFVGILKETFLADVNFLNPNALPDKMDAVWKDFNAESGIRAHLKQAYRDIADAAGDKAAIIVAGYPKLLNKDGALTISATNAQYVNNNVSRFNRKINSLVEECQKEGLNIHFVSVEDVFNGHEAYTDFPYINSAIFLAQSEDIDKSSVISSYSIHPNLNGARAYAEAVQKKIDELESKKSKETGDAGESGESGNTGESGDSGDTGAAEEEFSIVGMWRSVGSYGFGQASPGSTVIFDGSHCNFYSPDDTYEFYRLNGQWILQTKNVLWGDVLTFDVEILDSDHINVIYNGSVTELERIGSYGTVPAPEDDTSGGGNGLSGTYVSYAYGIIENTFTFYDGNRVRMDTLGIVGDGTYEIRNGEIVITYTTNISDDVCTWRAAFEQYNDDTIYIAGDEFVRQ